jgi:hypothetical protein
MENISPILFLILFAVFFSGVCFIISLMSGWHELANEYPLTGTFQGQRWHFRSANMRWGFHYNGCLTLGADQSGLFVSVLFPFRCGHPPLFIPWSDVSVRDTRYFYIFSMAEFRFQRAPSVPLYLRPALAQRLQGAAGSEWPGNPKDPGAAIQESLRA